jgi:hypothetical protein
MFEYYRRLLGGLLATLSVALFVGGGEGQQPRPGKPRPAARGKGRPAQGKKAPAAAAPGAGCFNLLNPNATGPDRANAYLLMLASHATYRNPDDPKAFRQWYAALFRRFGMKAFRFIEDARTATRLVVMSNDRAVVVSFRGTEPGSLGALVKTLKTDVQVPLVAVPWLPRGARAHQVFVKALNTVYRATANAIGRQGGFRGKKVFVTGHSLGGALAVLHLVTVVPTSAS